MTVRRVIIPAVALLLVAMGARVARASGRVDGVPGQVSLQVQVGGWDAPPRELNDLQRQGFHDGIEGARKDFENHRPMDVNNRDEYRHPHLPPEQREAYRDGFRRGYNVAMSHLMGGPGPAVWTAAAAATAADCAGTGIRFRTSSTMRSGAGSTMGSRGRGAISTIIGSRTWRIAMSIGTRTCRMICARRIGKGSGEGMTGAGRI